MMIYAREDNQEERGKFAKKKGEKLNRLKVLTNIQQDSRDLGHVLNL
jgi:hypothetical protein